MASAGTFELVCQLLERCGSNVNKCWEAGMGYEIAIQSASKTHLEVNDLCQFMLKIKGKLMAHLLQYLVGCSIRMITP